MGDSPIIVTSRSDPDLRAEISARSDGTFEIEVLRRVPEPDGQGGTLLVWDRVDNSRTLMASLELAEQEARRRLDGE